MGVLFIINSALCFKSYSVWPTSDTDSPVPIVSLVVSQCSWHGWPMTWRCSGPVLIWGTPYGGFRKSSSAAGLSSVASLGNRSRTGDRDWERTRGWGSGWRSDLDQGMDTTSSPIHQECLLFWNGPESKASSPCSVCLSTTLLQLYVQ